MSLQIRSLYRVLCAALLAKSALAAPGFDSKVRPSDCRPRDADSTCATTVAGAPVASPPPFLLTGSILYDGPLGGVPPTDYAYWGFDFIADASASPSPVRLDEFINRSSVPVTITLSFNFPLDHPCEKNCLPGVQFQTGPGWRTLGPLYSKYGNVAWVTWSFAPGIGYGWVINMYNSWNPRLTVSIPFGSVATLEEVGMSSNPGVATEIPAVPATCYCWDGTVADCSDGTRFSNGLLGPFYLKWDNYLRAGAFNNCPAER